MRPSTDIVKFMAPGFGVQAIGWGSVGDILKIHYNSKDFMFAIHLTLSVINMRNVSHMYI